MRIHIFHQKGYWFKIQMEFLWPILAKIELICQQPQMSGAHPSSGVPERMTGGSDGVVWLWWCHEGKTTYVVADTFASST